MDFQIGAIVLRVVLVMGAALVLTLSTVLAVKYVKIDMKDFKQRTGPRFMLIALAANLLFIAAVYLLMKWLDGRSIAALGFFFNIKDLLFSAGVLAVTISTALLFVIGYHRVRIYQIRRTGSTFLKKGEGAAFLLSFTVLFVAALQEEVMFRGYLGFVFHRFGFTAAMVLSAIIFTVWHFIGNKVNLFQTVDWLAGGFLLFFVYFVSGSIWVAAIAHFSRNLTNVLIFNIAGQHSLLEWDRPVSPGHKTLYILSCSLIIAVLTFIYY